MIDEKEVGFWRNLGYVFSGLLIIGGFILLGFSANIASQFGSQPGLYGDTFKQLGGLALLYGGVSTIILGIIMIWALVKSGQIESIDKNIKVIAEWIKSQNQEEGNSEDDERFLENEQSKLNERKNT